MFGGGPWLASGSRLAPIVARFYALEGDHDVRSAFDSSQWFASDTGAVSAPSLGAVLTFRAISLRRPDARAIRFALAPGSARRLSFGFALDPDIGPNAADDRSGFDAERDLAYVYDGESAVGYLLRDDAANPAIRAVRQYGIGRVPSRLPAASWDALHSTGVDLLPGARDVQLLLVSSILISSDAGVTLITVRAGSVGELQSRADSVIVALRALH